MDDTMKNFLKIFWFFWNFCMKDEYAINVTFCICYLNIRFLKPNGGAISK